MVFSGVESAEVSGKGDYNVLLRIILIIRKLISIELLEE